MDGSGEDQLHGSHGADMFTFVQDGKTDYITDFNPDWDRIDFTLFSDVSSFADLRIVKGCQGVMIYAGGEFLVLETERHNLDIEDLSAAHFIF
ncbi:MAG: M10 family metallopeptidase C-terminal domain-containing protein [Rhodobacteraceae bacterium]|nr:M10 family metallopeptidase C-terminal domain-containing protein [Paracoccaceae bacterium]